MASLVFSRWREEVFRSRTIAPLAFGMSQNAPVGYFGPPDTGGLKKEGRPRVLKYEDIEFHFDHTRDHALSLIFSDDERGSLKLCIPEWPHTEAKRRNLETDSK